MVRWDILGCDLVVHSGSPMRVGTPYLCVIAWWGSVARHPSASAIGRSWWYCTNEGILHGLLFIGAFWVSYERGYPLLMCEGLFGEPVRAIALPPSASAIGWSWWYCTNEGILHGLW